MSDIASQISSSVDSLMKEFEIITHNLANVNTMGYKRRCNTFTRALQAQSTVTEEDFNGDVELDSTLDFSQGNPVQTGRPLDFALYGKGLFVIETPDGPRYTRNGSFQISQSGQIVTCRGHIVSGQAGAITIPPTVGISELNVSSDGTITAGAAAIGKFRLVDFGDDQNKLISVGDGYFVMEQDITPAAAEGTIVKQGYQESSNVQMVEELVDMMMVTRLYEANMKTLQAQKEATDSLMNAAMG